MKVINPIGRKAGNEFAANNVRACMCGTDASFSSARTTADTCIHCGCNCKEHWPTSSNNYSAASGTYRTSSL